MPRRYPAQFRRKVLDLVAAPIRRNSWPRGNGSPSWRRSWRLIAKPRELLGDVVPQKAVRGDRGNRAGRLPVQLAIRVLGVSESGYYEWHGRAPRRVRCGMRGWPGRSRSCIWPPGGPMDPGRSRPSSPSAWASPSATARWRCWGRIQTELLNGQRRRARGKQPDSGSPGHIRVG